MSSAYKLSQKQFIYPFLIAILSNFVQSNELEKYSNICKNLTDSLHEEMNSNITTDVQIKDAKVLVASSEDFANGMHEKMKKLSVELMTFMEASKKYVNFLPKNQFQK